MENPVENHIINSDRNWVPDVLLLGPGGSKGYLELGPLLYFEQIGFLDNIHTIAGVSVGSIISLFIAANFTISEIKSMSLDINILDELTNNNNLSMIEKLKNIRDGSGLLSGDTIKNLINENMIKKWGKIGENITLSDLYKCTGRNLVITVTNRTKRRVEFINHINNPNLTAIYAILMSSAIPAIFHQRIYNGDEYCDGALSNPCPANYFDNGKDNVLAIYIDSYISTSISNPLLSLYDCINLNMNEYKKLIQKHCSNKVKFLDIKTDINDIIGISLTNQMRNKMILIGYNEGKIFYNNLKGIIRDRIIVPYNISLEEYQKNILTPEKNQIFQ
jgi:predicted acylesterase/phospholipase RssA